MKGIEFTKAIATGNDFVILDRVKARDKIDADLSELAKEICERKSSVGADGMLVLERSKKADFRMRVFNPDGSEVTMCGNGSRAVALYARTEGIVKTDAMRMETGAGIIGARVKGDIVRVRMTDPRDIKWNFCLVINECPYKVSFADTGVPHVVHFVSDIDKVDVKGLGSSLRYHKEFSPEGTNADFVQVVDSHTIKVRTYERGVEDETLACGTGVVASAIIAAESEKLNPPVTIFTRGGEQLKVYFDLKEGHFRNIHLEGRVRLLYKGRLL
jgi:diaminopimelate epimerase